jgi:cytochrome b561
MTDFTWTVLNAHKTAGLLILILGTARLIWRLQVPLPNWPLSFDEWDKSLSHFAEYGLYTCIFFMSLSGVFIEIAGGHYIPFFDLFYIDNLSPIIHWGAVDYSDAVMASRGANKLTFLHDCLVVMHIIGAYGVLFFFSVHITHVFRHQRQIKDQLLERMMPRSSDD